ncbi:DNA recombination protein RmuC [Campylobacter blaseri]|uniref:DNA recombination protein RmuC n=1 Tax=Campylobacter blaseri TaxID=2042961 RepID=UPI0012FFF870|nr:DNA recombination protein RmuC [Campylobacter blaseri]
MINEQNSVNQNFMNDFNDLTIDKFFMLNRNINEFLNLSSLNTTNNLNNNMNILDKRFQNILEKINDLEDSNSSSEKLKEQVIKLNSIFSNIKLRGIFGEIELKKILEINYGDNKNLYELQKKLSNNLMVDSVLYVKNKTMLPIDSKFPLTNYQKICEASSAEDSKNEISKYEKLFIRDIKNHIDDISNKYILPPETTEYAILFLPSEAIFTYICSNLVEIFEYMSRKNVFIASPSTLMAITHSINIFTKDEKIMKNTNLMKHHIAELSKEFEIFKKQNSAILNYATKLQDAIKILHKNSKKISEKFDDISSI